MLANVLVAPTFLGLPVAAGISATHLQATPLVVLVVPTFLALACASALLVVAIARRRRTRCIRRRSGGWSRARPDSSRTRPGSTRTRTSGARGTVGCMRCAAGTRLALLRPIRRTTLATRIRTTRIGVTVFTPIRATRFSRARFSRAGFGAALRRSRRRSDRTGHLRRLRSNLCLTRSGGTTLFALDLFAHQRGLTLAEGSLAALFGFACGDFFRRKNRYRRRTCGADGFGGLRGPP